MKTLTLLAALFLIIGFCTDATAMGYPHRLFGSKRATVKIAPQASRRGVVTTRGPDERKTGELKA